jgi:NADH-quinone oxidoreductase subunit M
MSVLILGGGLYPQPGVASRYHVAADLVLQRERRINAEAAPRIANTEDSPLARD